MFNKRLISVDISHSEELDKGPFGREDPWKYNEEQNYAPLAYIVAPFSGNVDQYTEKVRDRCRYAYDQGYIPVAPYLMYPRIYTGMDEDTNEFVVTLAANLMFKCDEVWWFEEDWPIRVHMSCEMYAALSRHKSIRIIPSGWEEEEDE